MNEEKTDRTVKENVKDKEMEKEAGKTGGEPCDDFDDILELVGSEGKFQKFLLYGVVSLIVALVPLFIMNGMFLLYEPDHWCHVPGRPSNIDEGGWKNMTIPREIGPDGRERFSQCLMYSNESKDGVETKVGCLYGWEYDRTDYDETIPSQENWVCNKSDRATNALTFASIGAGIGTIVFGPAADKFGRRPMYLMNCVLHLIFRILSLFVVHYYWIYLAVQVCLGIFMPLITVAPCLIVAEVIGMGFLPLLAWLSRTWFVLGVYTTIPAVIVLFTWYWIPESPRWLISKGRVSEAADVLQEIAKANGKSEGFKRPHLESMLNDIVQKQKDENKGEKKTMGMWTLFTRRRLAMHTILLTLSWSIDSLIYEGITLNATHLSGNQFLNFFILAIVEVPSGFLGGFLVNSVGRRWTQVIFALLCTLTSLGTALVIYIHPDWTSMIMALIVTAKFSVNLAFLVVYMQATELFPTALRSTGYGLSSTVSCVAAVFVPYLVYLGTMNSAAPYILLGGIGAIGAISSSFLPETLNHKLPETVEEANGFGKNQSYWDFKFGGGKSKDDNPKGNNIGLDVIPP